MKKMGRLEMTRSDFDEIMALCKGPVACNAKHECFQIFSAGRTPLENRTYVHGKLKLLDRIVDECLLVHPKGARIYINDQGAFREMGNAHDGESNRVQFVAFDIR
jgi:hypothetical protein